MKKNLSILIISILSIGLIYSGCKKSNNVNSSSTKPDAQSSPTSITYDFTNGTYTALWKNQNHIKRHLEKNLIFSSTDSLGNHHFSKRIRFTIANPNALTVKNSQAVSGDEGDGGDDGGDGGGGGTGDGGGAGDGGGTGSGGTGGGGGGGGTSGGGEAGSGSGSETANSSAYLTEEVEVFYSTLQNNYGLFEITGINYVVVTVTPTQYIDPTTGELVKVTILNPYCQSHSFLPAPTCTATITWLVNYQYFSGNGLTYLGSNQQTAYSIEELP